MIVCQIHRRIPQSRVAYLFIPNLRDGCYMKRRGLSVHNLQTISSSISSLILGSLLYLGRGMETQDNGFLLVIDGVRKEKERLTAANLLHTPLLDISSFISSFPFLGSQSISKISLPNGNGIWKVERNGKK